jgi:GNAT superfamily N-acetyltransferase
VEITRFDHTDNAALAGCDAVWRAVNAADNPFGARMSARVVGVWLRYGFDGDPAETWFARAPGTGDIVGWYRLELPDLENLDRAGLLVVVHPASRRRGFGRALLGHAARRASALGREVFGGEVRDGLAGDAFAAWAGATAGIGGALRVLDLRKVPDGKIAGMRADAARAAAGYSLVSWTRATPDEYLAGMAAVTNAHEDAPRDAGVEAAGFDADRIRNRADATVAAMGLRMYTIGAVHDATPPGSSPR